MEDKAEEQPEIQQVGRTRLVLLALKIGKGHEPRKVGNGDLLFCVTQCVVIYYISSRRLITQ